MNNKKELVTVEQMHKQVLQTLSAVRGNLQDVVSGVTTISDFCNTVEDAIKITQKQITKIQWGIK
tara:strand:+ start:1284 stop:1478 length:195 start_codon:yes stop_codon:yes gene_type:complete